MGNGTAAALAFPRNGSPVSPSNSTDVDGSLVWVGTGGTVVIDTLGGDTNLVVKVGDNQHIPFQVKRVRADNGSGTSTDAADMIACR